MALITIFQPFGANGRIIMEGHVEWSPIYEGKKSASGKIQNWMLAYQDSSLLACGALYHNWH